MNEINPDITNIGKISPVEPDKKLSVPLQKSGAGFDKILLDQLKNGDTPDPIKQTAMLPEIEGSFKAQQLNLKLDQAQFTQKLATSLDLLETYSVWLKDPDKSLKQVHGLLEQVSSQTKTLAPELKEYSGINTDLNQFMNEFLTTIEVEKIKFNRGDYLS